MNITKRPKFIITIGASAGGLNAISELVSQLDAEMDIAVLVVVHLSKVGLGSYLVHSLQKYTALGCSMAENGEEIKAGHIYLAPPDEHLLIKDGRIMIGDGPAENRWRPSIDVLFRSAAANCSNRVIGIILTGFLNDGMSGMWAIKRSGGKTIVQDPNEAQYPDMPNSVKNNMEVDFCVPLSQMGETIRSIIASDIPSEVVPVPEDVKKEAEIAESIVVSIDAVKELGHKSLYVCPDCGGGLWDIDNDIIKRYRCHIGHSYSEDDLLIKQSEKLEGTLWVALRMMEERRSLYANIAKAETDKGLTKLAFEHYKRAEELEVHIDKMRRLLFDTKKTG